MKKNQNSVKIAQNNNKTTKKNILGLVLSIISFSLFFLCCVALVGTYIWGSTTGVDGSVSGWPFVIALLLGIIPLFASLVLSIISIIFYFIEKKKTIIRNIFLILNIITIIVMIIVAIYLFIPKNYNYDDKNGDYNYTDDVEENIDGNTQPDNDIENNLYTNKSIELKDNYEELIVNDNLKIVFNGTLISNDEFSGEGYYEYIANIYLNNKLIETGLFNNNDKRVIWSSNYAATFSVSNLNNVYFIVSSIATQNGSNYVLIINSNGEVLDTYSDVHFNIDKDNKQFTIETCNGIMNPSCSKKIGTILDNNISY